MTAAAAAARGSKVLVGEPSGGWRVALVLALVVAGGLVEGVALGVAQSVGLSSWLPCRRAEPHGCWRRSLSPGSGGPPPPHPVLSGAKAVQGPPCPWYWLAPPASAC